MKKENIDNSMIDDKTKNLINYFLTNNFLDYANDKNPNRAYISQLYFPFYKNFKPSSTIDFSFPITVLVGKNGSGKSSILHALYGCPYGPTIEHFWFSTSVDPIEDGDGEHSHRYVYTYRQKGKDAKVLYYRASRPGTQTKKENMDYWETGKPHAEYGMDETKRFPPMRAKVTYIDFREQLSAYDKFFYFGNTNGLKKKSKQDFIRLKSEYLDNVLNSDKIYKSRSKKKNHNSSPISLTKPELRFISIILGVEYTSGKLVHHNFFRNEGDSILLTKAGFTYTEAHAGSGEFAVANLVHQIFNLKKNENNLILLDEPETSLYPGAQKRLLYFLLEMTKKLHCQIIIATHSQNFISELPNFAIKAIHFDSTEGISYITNGCSPSRVFEELDLPIPKCNVYTEDRAAALLVQAVANNENISKYFSISYEGDGATSLLKTYILSDSSGNGNNNYYILDGDMKIDKIDVENLPKVKLEDKNFINDLCNNICEKISFPSSKGKDNDSKEDIIKYKAQLKYLRYFYNHVHYLPKSTTPEQIIKDSQFLKSLIPQGCDINVSENRPIKDVYYDIVKARLLVDKPNSEQYYAVIQELIANWIRNYSESPEYYSIKDTLLEIKESYDKSTGK